VRATIGPAAAQQCLQLLTLGRRIGAAPTETQLSGPVLEWEPRRSHAIRGRGGGGGGRSSPRAVVAWVEEGDEDGSVTSRGGDVVGGLPAGFRPPGFSSSRKELRPVSVPTSFAGRPDAERPEGVPGRHGGAQQGAPAAAAARALARAQKKAEVKGEEKSADPSGTVPSRPRSAVSRQVPMGKHTAATFQPAVEADALMWRGGSET
jgi:hypothetical protein